MSLASAFHVAVSRAAADGKPKPMQICLRGSQPVGPGPVVRYFEDSSQDVFTIRCPAQESATGPVFTVPITFDANDLLWFSTGIEKDDQPMVIGAPGGGLVIPGRH
jgi:hypothetical protein